MKPRFHVGSVLSLVILLGATALWQYRNLSAVSYSGYARAETADLFLDLAFNPPVGKPGDRLQMTVRVANRTFQTQTPSIAITLPPTLNAEVYELPSGATFSVPDNRIEWQPFIPAAGEVAFQLGVQVRTTDVLNPEQVVKARLIHQGAEAQANAVLWLGIPPLIRETLVDLQVAVGQPLKLEAGVSGPAPIKVTWNLGDGRRLELAEPVVVFPATGHYDIIIEAANPAGTVSRRMNLTVLPNPVASFRPDDDTPAIGQPVEFISNSGGQPPLTVFWDFGDGNTVTGEQQPVHVYRQSGNYLVRLVVDNAYGRSEAFWPVNVGGPPVADFLIPATAVVGQPLEGQAFSNDSTVQYRWEMGDGRFHEGVNVRHVYRLPGDYYVTLIADNGHGETRVGRWLKVDPGITNLFLPLTANVGPAQPGKTDDGLEDQIPLEPAVESLGEQFVIEPIPFPAGTSPSEQLLAYLNAVRQRFDLPPLAYNYELSVAAQSHAEDKKNFPDNPHIGSDGTTAAERILRAGYRGGYAGEVTAWGYADPRLAVEFWVNSDSHRPILLNRLATDVGVGYVEDYGSSNVWHWTAEFAVSYGAPVQAVIRQQLPAPAYSALSTDLTNYSWTWPLPLAAGERFTVYLVNGNREIPVGTTSAPVYGSRYVVSVDAAGLTSLSPVGSLVTSDYQWFVRLENGQGGIIAESERRPITILITPGSTTPEPAIPLITATPLGPTAVPTATPVNVAPPPEPPPDNQPPVVITATPLPTPSP